MAGMSSQHGAYPEGNPITENKGLLGAPRNQSALTTDHHDNEQPLLINGQPAVTGLQGNTIPTNGRPDHQGNYSCHLLFLPLIMLGPIVNGQPADSDVSSSASSSEEEGEEEGSSDSSQEEEGELSDEMQLKNAGVEIDLEVLGTPSEGGVAPLHLLSEVSVWWLS